MPHVDIADPRGDSSASSAARAEPHPDDAAELIAKVFRTLGDVTRLQILEVLLERPCTVTELTRALGVSQSRISNHLACLRWCGFVTSRSEGKWSYYELVDDRVRAMIDLSRAFVSQNAERVAACARTPMRP